jgi:thymidylate kinase
LRRSRLIVLEGGNGVGKSTVARHLRDRLDAALFHYPPEFVRFREQAGLDVQVGPVARLLYYLAATVQLADLVRAELPRRHVICDRYLAAPLSLLLAEQALAPQEVEGLAALVEPHLCRPDLTLLLTADAEQARQRIRSRAGSAAGPTPVERRVLDGGDFAARREAALRRYAARLGPLLELDTTALSPEEMCRRAWSLVAERLGPFDQESE